MNLRKEVRCQVFLFIVFFISDIVECSRLIGRHDDAVASNFDATHNSSQGLNLKATFAEHLSEFVLPIFQRRELNESSVPGSVRHPDGDESYLAYRGQCHDYWQDQYIKLHRDMLLGPPSQEQRILVYFALDAGLADRMISAVSSFFYALLTRRAFKIHWGGEFRLESGYSQPSINWTFDPEYDMWSFNNTAENPANLSFYQRDPKFEKNKEQLVSLYQRTDLNLHLPDHRTIIMHRAHGRLRYLFNNPHHSYQLQQWGFRPETAFGCVFRFLFYPTSEALAQVADVSELVGNRTYLAQEARLGHVVPAFRYNPGRRTVIIGIQLRTGDKSMRALDSCDRKIDEPNFKLFFECAKTLEEDLDPSRKELNIFWKSVKKMYGKKVITSLKVKTDHSFKSNAHQVTGFQSAVGESWVFGRADYHILTEMSTFGRLGALISLRTRSIFNMNGRSLKRCRAADFDEFKITSNHQVIGEYCVG
ncbi:hypothetical protein CEUSTIGMA_g2358.t1 [Chlamydomonas eustigma]|uniref:Uncharacterized protein n=1 Tax=Chlamydomonas eustigma TaxID=1157962 RepID=A0A250WWB2_9CHLO|nr:hypothetical protein CEUSTIGMA_g2358.t1 [Chlamydomonas eustigma]|eukprot:GAX74912.1 hypothetical protein CEUSTIGMA_g2358.t1 [Chlamydomonas eustigma]